MSARYDKEWVARQLNAERRLGPLSPEQLLSSSGVKAGMTVVDYGCGPGFFTLPAAGIVGPEGLAYALDIEQRMVSLVASRATESGYANVRAVLNDADDAPLPDAIADFAICVLVMHYREERDGRVAIARDLGRLVKPGSRVLLVQWNPDWSDGQSHGISFEETAAIMAEGGFGCDGPNPLAERQYVAISTKRP